MARSPWVWPAAAIVVVAVAGVFGAGWAWGAAGMLAGSGAAWLGWCVLRETRADSVAGMGKIRPLALGVVRHEGKLLVFEGSDVGGRRFHRPLGGGIEFGETAEAALRREFREELGAELTNVERFEVLENIFPAHDGVGHEIVVLFTADLVDRSLYAREDLVVLDDGSPVRWLPLADVAAGAAVLYPAGLPGLLSGTPRAR